MRLTLVDQLSPVGFCTGRRQEEEDYKAVSTLSLLRWVLTQAKTYIFTLASDCTCVGFREPDWGFVEILKLVAMGLVWGVVVLGVIHFSMWLGAWWDNNIGTPGKPGWRSQKTFQ